MAIININKLVTIDRHIAEEEHLHPEATGEFTLLLHDLTFAIRLIASEVRRAGLNDILGLTESINVHGEKVRKIDEYANLAIMRSMESSGFLCAMASEESEEMIKIPSKFKKGKYILVFDPLDGSTNIDVDITIGTIFSLYRRLDPNSKEDASLDDILQKGVKQAAAGYILYGSSTILVYSTGHGVNAFTYDPIVGEFFLTFKNIQIPYYGYHYSCNEANSVRWSKQINEYIYFIKNSEKFRDNIFSLRYTATAAADIHRTLHTGGIYFYPPDPRYPKGKIRLVYEANPLAFIVEQAGGIATTGKERILQIKPDSIHQRIPFYIGSKGNILEFEGFLNND